MTDTDTETLPNGTGGMSAEEEERLKQRPADIDADVREMERRKRVEALMSSRLFREELERVLEQQLHEGGDAPLLQRITEMVGGRVHAGAFRGPSCVLPINDIRGIEGVGYEKGEKILRCKLAAVYRLVDLFGWAQSGSGQITARLNTAVEQVLTTPRGLLPHEVTASSLVKVDMQGVVQEQGTTNFPVNVEGFSLHASVHAARPDVRCVLHVRSPAALAVSATKNGLLPLCSEAALLGELAYHRVPAGLLDNEERDKLVRALGPSAKVLVLNNGGVLCCGETLEEAFYQAKNLTTACEVQMRVASLPLDSLSLIDADTKKQMYDASRRPPADGVKWRVGGEEFEALMRMLDNAGFRTGYIYRHPLIKSDVPKPKNDVEVPPAVSSLGYLLEEEELYKQGLWKKGVFGKTGERTRWLNSPNVYQKVEVLETGTNDPKKITKWVDANNEEWVQDGSPAHSSTPFKIDGALQFVPKNTNPKEFKLLQQQIKDNRIAEKISAGPQSHILEGVTWDEAAKLAAEDAHATHTGDHVVLMGAASKGIIQRGYQHNATMYSAPYARNPFDHVTDREIQEYRRTVERRQRGDYDTDLSESEAISGAQITSPASAPSETEEESRDEHRVLRIETKQAPVRSQPEVVLSDAAFLNAERAHSDMIKDGHESRDPNPLSDDEVFLDSTVSSMSSVALSPVVSPPPPVVVRAVMKSAVLYKGAQIEALNLSTKDQVLTRKPNPSYSTNSRTRHDYSRTNNFDTITKFYEFSNNIDITKARPKCKVSLNRRLASSNEHVNVDTAFSLGYGSSRSSLYSVPSIDWDYRNRNDFHTRSLPRPRKYRGSIYRTNSHSGFVNAFIKNPDPVHYHIPRSRSCGTIESSMFFEFPKSVLNCESSRPLHHNSLSSIGKFEVCKDNDGSDLGFVKAKLDEIPVLNLGKRLDEFIHSQEFNEDSYINDITGYPIEKQDINDKTSPSNVLSRENLSNIIGPEYKLIPQLKELYDQMDCDSYRAECAHATYDDLQPTTNTNMEMKEKQNTDGALYRAECVYATENDVNNETFTSDSIVGEYLNFSGEFDIEPTDFVSPVKELIKKDIRNYSVPLNYYCDDYVTPKTKEKSPHKLIEQINPLEPIMEESKSSYGDETSSTNLSNESKVIHKPEETLLSEVTNDVDLSKECYDDMREVTEFLESILQRVSLVAELKEIITKKDQNPTETLQAKCDKEPDADTIESAIAVYTIDECSVCTNNEDEVIDALFNDIVNSLSKDLVKGPVVVSTDTPNIDVKSIEVIVQDCVVSQYGVSSSVELTSFNSTVEFENLEAVGEILSLLFDKVQYEITSRDHAKLSTGHLDLIGNVLEVKENETDESVTDCSDDNANCNFSITTLVQYFEEKSKTFTVFSDSDLTDVSEVDKRSDACKIVESVICYVFDEVFHLFKTKNKKGKKVKEVVTVVDSEDILYTAMSLWNQNSLVDKIINEIISESIEGILNTDDLQELKESQAANTVRDILQSSLDNELNKCTIISPCLSDTEFNDNYDEINSDTCKQTIDLDIIIENKEYALSLDSLLKEKEKATDTPIHEVDPVQCTKGFETISKKIHVLYTRNENSSDHLNSCPSDTDYNDEFHADERKQTIELDITSENKKYSLSSDSLLEEKENVTGTPTQIILGQHEVDPAQCTKGFETITKEINVLYTRNENSSDHLNSCPSDTDYNDEFHADERKQTIELDITSENKKYSLSSDSLLEEKENVTGTPTQIILGQHEVDPAQCTKGFETITKEIHVLYTRNENSSDNLNRGIDYVAKKLDFDQDDGNCSVKSESSLKTFIVDDEATALNNAFCDDGIFNISYDESINSCDRTYDCSNLYERDDAILGSPFVKRLSVLSMSQIEQRGGIKYWLSFDDCQQTDCKENRPIKRFVEDKIPSFLSYETAELGGDSRNATGVKRHDDEEKQNNSDSFSSALACKNHDLDARISGEMPSAFEESNVQISSSSMNRRDDNRNFFQGYSSSWPPYEDTLFYRILSKFRLSESFDPNYLGRPHSSV